jgi:hypothetical protein
MTVTCQNSINEEIGRLISGSVCYHVGQNLLSLHLLSKKVRFKYKPTKHQFYLLLCLGVKLGLSLCFLFIVIKFLQTPFFGNWIFPLLGSTEEDFCSLELFDKVISAP